MSGNPPTSIIARPPPIVAAADGRHACQNSMRACFSAIMSAMYRQEVPAYGTLLYLVAEINRNTLADNVELAAQLDSSDDLTRISDERHGAIRLGSAAELTMMRRAFAQLGMHPVGYYDLSTAGIPVHSTAFRPTDDAALAQNPFRVFTSLLRLELIDDALRQQATQIIAQRQIFTPAAIALINRAEEQGGLDVDDATQFVHELLETFRWHADATVPYSTYRALHDRHRLIADIVCFRGPHINHLTPRTLDIDSVQALMPAHGITPKAIIEGPPLRQCPILLRQTSFHALTEDIVFSDNRAGSHCARFGEIEQRGVALTPAGRMLYDSLLDQTRQQVTPAADGGNAEKYKATLADTFAEFPDDWRTLHDKHLAYFKYAVNPTPTQPNIIDAIDPDADIIDLLNCGALTCAPITYEDFLPVSAAGIFQSNLGDAAKEEELSAASRQTFEEALGQQVADEFQLYQQKQAASLTRCRKILTGKTAPQASPR